MARKIFRQSRRPQIATIPFGPFTQGVNQKAEPHLIDFSEMSASSNVIVDEFTGKLNKRPGSLFRVAIPTIVDAPRRAFNFIKRDGTEILLITDNKKIVSTEDFVTFSNVTPEAFLTNSKFAAGAFYIDFAVAEDLVWITNGTDSVFSWDGTVAGTSTESFIAYDQETTAITYTSGGGTLTSLASGDFSGNPFDRSGDGTTWVGQTLVCTSATNTGNIGITRPVLTFNDTTDAITFAAFPSAVSTSDVFKVGVIIPKGRNHKYHHNTLFEASTSTNAIEVRFHADVDPNEPSIVMKIGNPNAWPSLNQFEVGSGDDRIWGFSNPVYRNRIAVFKSNGIYRIDPHPTFQYVPVTITEQVGSRFPTTWHQHGNRLMFLGQDRDGLPDIYTTDLEAVEHFNRKHKTTLDALQQPSTVSKSLSIASQAEWDAGTKSDFIDTSSNSLSINKISTESIYSSRFSSATDVDISTNSGSVRILGFPNWGTASDGATTLSADGWSLTNSNPALWTTVGSVLEQSDGSRVLFGWNSVEGPNSSTHFVKYAKTLDSSVGNKDVFLRTRIRWKSYPYAPFDTTNNVFAGVTIRNGAYEANVTFTKTKLFLASGTVATGLDFTSYVELAILLKSNGTAKVWADGVLKGTTSGNVHASKEVGITQNVQGTSVLGSSNGFLYADFQVEVDYINYHEDFKGDDQSSHSAISPSSLPSTLPTTASFLFKFDYNRALSDNASLHGYGKFHTDTTANGNTIAFKTQSSTDDSTYDTLTSISTGEEPGVDNGTAIRRYLRYKTSFTYVVSTGLGPTLDGIVGGIIYYTSVARIGDLVAAWDILQLDNSSLPPNFTAKIRMGTDVNTEPNAFTDTGWNTALAGTDAEGFVTITSGDNIGTILGGNEDAPNPPSPDTRWAQIKFSGSLDSIDESNGIDSMVFNWIEGSAQILPTNAIIYKKRWLLIAANVDSATNDTIVSVDSNNAFNDWSGLDVNFFVFFRGALYAGSALRNDVLEIKDSLLQDDDGPDVTGRKTKAISASIETKQEFAGAIFTRKKARYLETLADNETSSIAFSYKRDVETSYTSIGTVAFTASATHKRLNFPMGLQFKRITLKAANATLNEDMPLEGMVLIAEQTPSRSGL